MLNIVREWDKVRPSNKPEPRRRHHDPLLHDKVDNAMAFCSEGMTTLKAIQFKKGLELRDVRWEAHRDLMLAELSKVQFMLEEYKTGFKALRGVPLTRNGGPLNGFHATLNPGGAGGGSTPAARKLYESAVSQFNVVIEKHAQTPWAAVAANERDHGLRHRHARVPALRRGAQGPRTQAAPTPARAAEGVTASRRLFCLTPHEGTLY